MMSLACICLGITSCKREGGESEPGEAKAKAVAESKKHSKEAEIEGLPGGPPSRYRQGMRRHSGRTFGVPGGSDADSPTSTTHRSSKYSNKQPPIPGVAQQPTKRLAPSEPTEEEKSQSLVQRLSKATTKQEVMGVLNEAAGFNSEAILPLVGALMSNPDPDIQGQALALLQGVTTPDALPVVKEGLKATEEDVRLVALEVAESIQSEQVAPVISSAMADADKDVRQAAFAQALQREGASRDGLLADATRSTHVDIAIAALNVVRSESKKSTVPLVIEALGHSHALVKDLAHETIYLAFQNDLQTPAQATQWWNEHQQYFDDNLALKDPSDLNKILPQQQ